MNPIQRLAISAVISHFVSFDVWHVFSAGKMMMMMMMMMMTMMMMMMTTTMMMTVMMTTKSVPIKIVVSHETVFPFYNHAANLLLDLAFLLRLVNVWVVDFLKSFVQGNP
jgi:glycerol-3-phosphate acyltransferase PlsY